MIFNAGAKATEVTLDVCNLLPDGILMDVWGGLPGGVFKEKLRGFGWRPRARPRSSSQGEVMYRYAMRNCTTDARASPPLMSGTILNSSAVTPARSVA